MYFQCFFFKHKGVNTQQQLLKLTISAWSSDFPCIQQTDATFIIIEVPMFSLCQVACWPTCLLLTPAWTLTMLLLMLLHNRLDLVASCWSGLRDLWTTLSFCVTVITNLQFLYHLSEVPVVGTHCCKVHDICLCPVSCPSYPEGKLLSADQLR